MTEVLRFDGRVAIVTGAGGNPGLGRAHAMLLASRGARVVVNDIGRDVESPHYLENASAEAVAAEIRALGGEAIADVNSVAEEQGAQGLIETALAAFGRVDILVNNAGLSIAASFAEITARDLERHIDINLKGTAWTCKAAWPHMVAAGYGRIINTSSLAMAGFASMVVYGASKGGVFSLTRGLAVEGAAFGIKANAINPGAYTRLVASQQDEASPTVGYLRANMAPEHCAPVVAFLAHENCPVTGECIEAVGGEVRRTYLAQTRGFREPALTPETLTERWEEVMTGATESIVPIGAMDTSSWGFLPYQAGTSSGSSS